MIGAAVGAVFGGCAGEIINTAIPGNAAIAEPQAYALVGMAATLASVCSVPLTSVLLLFELTRDYRILLPLMGAVGLAIWVPSVTTQPKELEAPDSKSSPRGYSVVSPTEDKDEDVWWRTGERNEIELSFIESFSNYNPIDVDILLDNIKVSHAMSNHFLKISLNQTLGEALSCMRDGRQNYLLVVEDEDYLEGILTDGDIKRWLANKFGESSNSDPSDVNTCTISSIFTRGMRFRGPLICYPDTDLAMAKQLMEAKGIKQLPVIKRAEDAQRRRKIVAILHYDSVWSCLSCRKKTILGR